MNENNTLNTNTYLSRNQNKEHLEKRKQQTLKLLIVEDNPIDQKLLFEYLDELSIKTSKTIVQTLADARCYLISNINFDLIILDLNLPDSKGINTITAIKELTTNRILIFTGSNMDVQLLEDFEIKGHLPKDKLTSANLDYQIQLALSADEMKKSRNILSNATDKLERAIRSQEKRK